MSGVSVQRPALADTFPLRLGDAAEFAAIRSWLIAAGFDERTICRVLEIDELADLRSSTPETADHNADGVLPLLIRLFLYSVSLPHALVADRIAPEMLAALQSLDLLRAGTFARGQEHGDW